MANQHRLFMFIIKLLIFSGLIHRVKIDFTFYFVSIINGKSTRSKTLYSYSLIEFLKLSSFAYLHIFKIHLQIVFCVPHKFEIHWSYDVT